MDAQVVSNAPSSAIVRPHTRVSAAQWLLGGVILSLLQPSFAQAPASLTPATTIFVAVIACLITIIGSGLNLLAMYFIFQRIWTSKRSSFQLCLLSLCLSDFIITSFLIPLAAIRFYYRSWTLSFTLCRLSCLALYGTVTWVLFNLIMIAAYRYFRLRDVTPSPADYPRKIVMLILTIMCLSYLLPTLAFLGVWGLIDYKPTDPSVCTILPDAMGHSPKPHIWITGLIVPFVIIYVASFVIHCRVRQHRASCPPSIHRAHSLARLRNTMVRVLITFLLGYQPILLLNTIDNAKTWIPAYVHLGSMLLAWLTTILHPVVYIFRHRRARSLSGPRMQSDLQPRPSAENKSSTSMATTPEFSPSVTESETTSRESQYVTIGRRQSRLQRILITFTLILALVTMSTAKDQPKDHAQMPIDLLTVVPPAIYRLPPCKGFTAPLVAVPACISTAVWIGLLLDASVCFHIKSCSGTQIVSNDGSSCMPPPPTCTSKEIKPAFIDSITCQETHISDKTPNHIILKDVIPEYCAIGNLHLRTCYAFKESIQAVPVLIMNGILHPVTELHISDDAGLTDLDSYNCSCDPDTCWTGNCHGDSTFCANIGCPKDLSNNPSPCYCKYTNNHVIHVYHAAAGELIPDCWGHLTMIIKTNDPPSPPLAKCGDCFVTCETTGLELHTPGRIPKYIKATKNPGFVSVIPASDTTKIQFTNHMLISHGSIMIEIWFPEADYPVFLQQTCPRLNVCQVINCHFCYDRWVNVTCYDWINWVLLVIFLSILTIAAILTRHVTRIVWFVIWWLTWPCRKLWTCRRRDHLRKFKPTPLDEEQGMPLLPMSSPNPYRTTTTKRSRDSGFHYRGPLAVIMALGSLIPGVTGCSEFASLAASSTECRYGANMETCHLQLNTRLAVSPIGQRSCFKIANHQQKTLGTIEFETGTISVLCDKQLLYYVPRAIINCQSHIQCYSLYSSSDCHGDKCTNFGLNDTVAALESTKHSLGWSSCLDLRYPSCPWWLTRDCHFIRTAFMNPTRQTYEVFNCPTWQYAVTTRITTRFSGNSSTFFATLRVGETKSIQQLNLTLISTSVPPLPVLDHCFLQQDHRTALAPCNERGEIGIGRLGEIQCDSDMAAQTVSMACRATQSIINTKIDTTGIKCSGDLVDPELLLNARTLPLKMDSGVITASGSTVVFDTSQSSLLELQIGSSDLILTAEVQLGKCTATFVKLEGCYSCLSGAVLFLQAQSDSVDSVTGTLECPHGILYTQMVITNVSSTFTQIVQVSIPDVDVACKLICPANTVDLHVMGHLHYLSNSNFQRTSEVISHHSVTSGGLDFHWLSLFGSNLYSWIFRGLIFLGLLVIFFVIIYVGCRFSSRPKQA